MCIFLLLLLLLIFVEMRDDDIVKYYLWIFQLLTKEISKSTIRHDNRIVFLLLMLLFFMYFFRIFFFRSVNATQWYYIDFVFVCVSCKGIVTPYDVCNWLKYKNCCTWQPFSLSTMNYSKVAPVCSLLFSPPFVISSQRAIQSKQTKEKTLFRCNGSFPGNLNVAKVH